MAESEGLCLLFRHGELRMAVIYVREYGVMVSKQDEQLVLTQKGQKLVERPVLGIDGLALFGNVQMSSQAAVMLMERGIDVSYFTYGGKYIGHLASDASKNIFLRLAQVDCYQDDIFRIDLAQTIIRNKLENQIQAIRSYRWDEIAYEWKSDVKSIQELLDRLPEKMEINAVMGIEGLASNIYFHSYGQMFRGKIEFPGRNRRPPRDPINIALSLCYTMLTREVEAALEAESFELGLGFIHGIRYGRKSLALDMVEEFRQPMADRMVLRLFNKQMLSSYDFESYSEEPPHLTEPGFRTFFREYEKWMKEFRPRIRKQAALLKQAIRKREKYLPYSWKQTEETCM